VFGKQKGGIAAGTGQRKIHGTFLLGLNVRGGIGEARRSESRESPRLEKRSEGCAEELVGAGSGASAVPITA